MAVDIELAINLIQAQNAGVTWTKADGSTGRIALCPSLDKYPTNLTTANLPCVITWPADGSWYIKGGGYRVDHRAMRILGFVEPLGQSDIPSRALDATRLLQALRNLWITASTVPIQDPVGGVNYQITAESGPDKPHTDRGLVSDLSFGGTTYHGFEITLNIRTLWSST